MENEKKKDWTPEQVDTTISMTLAFLCFIGLIALAVWVDIRSSAKGAERLFSRDIMIYLFGVVTTWVGNIMSSHYGKKMAEMQNQKQGTNQKGDAKP